MKHIPAFQEFINESTTTMGVKAEKYRVRVGNLRGKSKTAPVDYDTAMSIIASLKLPECDTEEIRREVKQEYCDSLNDAIKTLNIQPADAMVCFTARPGYSDDLVYIADRCKLDYVEIEVDDDMAIVFGKNQ